MEAGTTTDMHVCVCVHVCVRGAGGRGEGGWLVGGEGLQHTFVQSTYLRSNTRIFVSACRLLSANSLSFLSSSPSSSLILCGVRTQVDSCKSRAKSHGHMTSSRERCKLEVLITGGSSYYRKFLLPEVLITGRMERWPDIRVFAHCTWFPGLLSCPPCFAKFDSVWC